MAELDKMSQPNPEAQQAQMMQQQLQLQTVQAQLALIQAQTAEKTANAQQIQVETMMIPEEQRVKAIQAASTNLDNGDDFEKRLKLADTMLKEKQINLKAADIASNERIATMQMQNKQYKM
jgi:hypothetical protein